MILLSVTVVIAALAADPQAKGPPAPTSRQVRQAVQRGLAFLEKDAAKWRKEHTCATCHHGAMTVWAFNEAKGRGLPVRPETLADLAGWSKERFVHRFDPAKDLRPGFNVMPVALV